MSSEYRRRDSSRYADEYGDSDEWYEAYDKDRTVVSDNDRHSQDRSRSRTYDRSPDRRRNWSPHSTRKRSRSRSRDVGDSSDYYSRRGRQTDGATYHESSRSKYRREPPEPSNTIIVKGLPLTFEPNDILALISREGFAAKDVRILKRKDTGTSRGFGFIEFASVDEGTAWLKHTEGRLCLEGDRVADMEFSSNRIPHNSASSISASLQRFGDWICGKCGTVNFKKRDTCFKCNVRREDSDCVCGEGFADIGVVPSDTLLLRNLPYEADENTVLESLKHICSEKVRMAYVARNSETGFSRGFGYVQLHSVTEAAQMLTNLTAVTKLIIGGREVLISYSNVPLDIVITRNALSHNLDVSNRWNDASQSYYNSSASINQQADAANAAAAVAQNAIKKAQVMRQVAITNNDSMYGLSNPSVNAIIQEATNVYSTPTSVPGSSTATNSGKSSATNFGKVSTPHGEMPVYPTPDVSTYTYDLNSGYYYDSSTGLYYDAKTSYYYNPFTQQFMYWDASYRTYLPAPTQGVGQTTTTNNNNVGSENAPPESGKTKKTKSGQDKVKVAKKIQKDMEKWAKQMNHRKVTPSRVAADPAVPIAVLTEATGQLVTSVEATTVASPSHGADTTFVMFDRSAGDLGRSSASPPADEDTCASLEPTATTEEDIEEQLIDMDRLICLLCRRQFANKETLVKHQQFSDLHKKNVHCKRMETLSVAHASSKPGASSTGRYRDRAKERREKFGFGDEPQPNKLKEKYMVESASEQTTSTETAAPLSAESKGAKLMRSMGWQDGQGLGRKNQGITDPILAERRVAGVGLGMTGSIHKTSSGASYKDHVKAALRQKFESLV